MKIVHAEIELENMISATTLNSYSTTHFIDAEGDSIYIPNKTIIRLYDCLKHHVVKVNKQKWNDYINELFKNKNLEVEG